MRQRELPHLNQTYGIQVRAPVEAGRCRVRGGHAQQLVAARGIAQFLARQVRARQARFQFNDTRRMGVGAADAAARQREHPRDVFAVGVPLAPRVEIATQVEIPIGQAEPALEGIGDDSLGIFEVRLGDQIEQQRQSVGVQLAQHRQKLRAGVDGGYRIQFRLDRREAQRLKLPRIRRRAEHAPNQPFRRSFRRIPLRRRLAHDAQQPLVVAVLDLVESTPARIRRRHRIARQPAAVGVLVEVLAGGNGNVEIASGKPTVGGLRRHQPGEHGKAHSPAGGGSGNHAMAGRFSGRSRQLSPRSRSGTVQQVIAGEWVLALVVGVGRSG